jgi:hypothetical protein
MSLDDLDPVLVLPPLPANLDALQRADLVVLCDGVGLLTKRSETAAALRERLRDRYLDAARREREHARYQREAAYRKRVPAPRPDPALEAVRAGLWGLANLVSTLDRANDIASTIYAVLPALAGYVNDKGVTREEAQGALTTMETALRLHAHHMEVQSGQVGFSLGDVSRLQQHHAAADDARREARNAEKEARVDAKREAREAASAK